VGDGYHWNHPVQFETFGDQQAVPSRVAFVPKSRAILSEDVSRTDSRPLSWIGPVWTAVCEKETVLVRAGNQRPDLLECSQ
jgi:hypothetical protein